MTAFSPALLEEVKDKGQDFEWYPTSKEIISKVCQDIPETHLRGQNHSLLDVGAGNGSVFALFAEIEPKMIEDKYAIEISERLINAMPKDVFVVGTDFHEQTLIDKEVDLIFCNPPYSEYEEWAAKIVLEANCSYAYLVLPQRWVGSKKIKAALDKRQAEAQVIGSFDFMDSEFRQARAKVDIIRVQFERVYEGSKLDPFSIWFDSVFSLDAEQQAHTEFDAEKEKDRVQALVNGKDLVVSLVEVYNQDVKKLYENYKSIEKLDRGLLEELGVNVDGLKRGLRQKITGLKNLYWNMLFDRFEPITTRLTSNSRKNILNKLTRHTTIDFTVTNAYAIVIWVIKNANSYLDSQLLAVYNEMVSQGNIKGYKSNKRFQTDEWRYLKYWDFKRELENNGLGAYMLEYRLVFQRHACFSSDTYWKFDFPNDLYKDTHDFINDVFTVAGNLGFAVIQNTFAVGTWIPGQKKVFYYNLDGKKNQVFAEIRAFKNGNIHCQFSQEFMKALNIEAGRLLGWLRCPEEANEELEVTDAEVYFKRNVKFLPSDVKLFLEGPVSP